MIKKQVLLDGNALDAYNSLRQRLSPLVRDSHLIRIALILAAKANQEELDGACTETFLAVGRPKEKKCPKQIN